MVECILREDMSYQSTCLLRENVLRVNIFNWGTCPTGGQVLCKDMLTDGHA